MVSLIKICYTNPINARDAPAWIKAGFLLSYSRDGARAGAQTINHSYTEVFMLSHRHPSYLYVNMQQARDNFSQLLRVIETHPVFKGAVVTRYGKPVAVINALGRPPEEAQPMPLDTKYARRAEKKGADTAIPRQDSPPE